MEQTKVPLVWSQCANDLLTVNKYTDEVVLTAICQGSKSGCGLQPAAEEVVP